MDGDFAGTAPDEALSELLGVTVGWPLDPAEWEEDTFLGLVEVVHDFVARPRERWWHDYGGCGWHYSQFAVAPARMLYRERIDRLLVEGGIPLRLAADGEDVGRLVHSPADGRESLMEAALKGKGALGPVPDTVQHAVSLFRRRGATVEDKRSACISLAGILEERRSLVKADLLSKDEGALFQIANQFGIRHRRADQQSDYAVDYLDWVFWSFLATVELTGRLLSRGAGRP